MSFALVKAEADAGHPATDMVLEVGADWRLRIPRGVDAAALRTVLMVLREQA